MTITLFKAHRVVLAAAARSPRRWRGPWRRRRERRAAGGTLKVLDTAGGIDSLDPGYWYYQADYQEVGNTTQRQLYGWKPDETKPTPDLAEDLPAVSNGGKTLTIKLKPDIKYSAPLQTRTVKAADVKYALERCFLPQVGNGYATVYYSDIVGVKAYQDGKADEISGIETPDDQTLVIKLRKPAGDHRRTAARSACRCTVPVPKDYAQKYDKGKQSTYGEHQVFTGPYMIENDGKGKITGYKPSKRLTLVRNPSWDKSTDFKPAYFDRIEVTCCSDATVAAQQDTHRPGLPERRLRRSADAGPEAGAVLAQGPDLGRAERRKPLHLAQHDGQAARQRQRASGDQRRDRPDRAAPDARRPDARHDRDALPSAGHRRLRGGGRRRRAPASTSCRARRRTSRSPSST